jgi:hypothetical protein
MAQVAVTMVLETAGYSRLIQVSLYGDKCLPPVRIRNWGPKLSQHFAGRDMSPISDAWKFSKNGDIVNRYDLYFGIGGRRHHNKLQPVPVREYLSIPEIPLAQAGEYPHPFMESS